MEFSAKAITDLAKLKTACLIIPVKKGKSLSGLAKDVDRLIGGSIKHLDKSGDFCGETAQCLMLNAPNGLLAERLLLLGIGDAKLSISDYHKCISAALSAVKASPSKDCVFCIDTITVNERNARWQCQQLGQIAEAASYKYTTTKAAKKTPSLRRIVLASNNQKILSVAKTALKTGKAIGIGMNTAKQLGNLPANLCTPTFMANHAKAAARKHKSLTAKILSEKQMAELGMGALLSVTAGTVEPAKLIILEYKGAAKSEKPFVLVGKGITFDSGGISLKPAPKMDEMKYDMCGAASVLGTMAAITELNIGINVVAIIAAAENLPSGIATKPGDVITSMSGQTIEILNTDAEGRLVLCDALTYAEKYKPQAVVDLATLTGACIVALGSHASALYSNQEELAEQLLEAGQYTHDRAWQMPLWDEYHKQLESNFADLPNIGSPGGGSIVAACFLSKFASKYNWAHLDIAGTSFNGGGTSKGATGRPVPLLTQYLIDRAGK